MRLPQGQLGGIPELPGPVKNLSKSAKSQPELPGFGRTPEVTHPALAGSATSALPLIGKPKD
jgi:hypothetical protein